MKFLHSDASISPEAYHERSKILSERIDELRAKASELAYSSPESFLKFPDDSVIQKEIEKLVTEKGGDSIKHIFVVGIGGANLGAKALYDGLIGFLEPLKDPLRRMIFLDTDDPSIHKALEEYISALNVILVMIIGVSSAVIFFWARPLLLVHGKASKTIWREGKNVYPQNRI